MTTTEHTKTTIVTLSGAEGVVTAAAHLLGFPPAESLVLVCLTRDRGRVGPVIRIDLDALRSPAVLDNLADTVAEYADHAAVIVYHEAVSLPPLAGVRRALGKVAVPISYQLSVSRGRIREASSAGTYRRDRGVAVPTTGDSQFDTLAAAAALVGKGILPDREALAASITPEPAKEQRLVTGIKRALRGMPMRDLARDAPLSVEQSVLVDEIWATAAAQYREQGFVTADAAAPVIAMMQVIPCRDQILARSLREGGPDYLSVLASLAAQCPQRYAPELCSVLAAAAYRFGDGALANCALDRALAGRPDHRLSYLLRATIENRLHPSTLASLGDRPIPADAVTATRTAPPREGDPPQS